MDSGGREAGAHGAANGTTSAPVPVGGTDPPE